MSHPPVILRVIPILLLLVCASPAVGAMWDTLRQDHPDQPGEVVDFLRDGVPLARFVFGEGQPKPYLHVFGSDGELLTKGDDGGTYEHHRGIFLGWDEVESDLGSHDLWHLDTGRMEVLEIEHRAGNADSAVLRARIAWRAGADGGEGLVLTEWRSLRVSGGGGGATVVDQHVRLRAERDLRLDGDLHHAGVHFRAAQEVFERSGETSYLEDPVGEIGGGAPMAWSRLLMPRGERWYSVLLQNSPDNPVEELSQREYGRFGYFFAQSMARGARLALNHRITIREESGLAAPPALDAAEESAARDLAGAEFDSFVAALQADGDGDGFTGAEETRLGSDPHDPASVPVSRPRDPWVFRVVMENRTRMLVAALHSDLWLSFSPDNCGVDRVWSGGMDFKGKVFPDFSQKNSWVSGVVHHRAPNAIFEATDESTIPPGWSVSGGLDTDISRSMSDGQRYLSPQRDARIDRVWGATSNDTVLTSPVFDLSGHDRVTLFHEQRSGTGSNWPVAGAGAVRVEVSEDGGTSWDAQVFYGTDPRLSPHQSNYKELLSRSPQTRLRLSIRGAEFANLVLEGDAKLWTARTATEAVPLSVDWLGYRTVKRREAVLLRYALVLEDGTRVEVSESPEAVPGSGAIPELHRSFTIDGLPAGTTLSLRLSGDARWSDPNESFAVDGNASLERVDGIDFLEFASDGTATVLTSWNP